MAVRSQSRGIVAATRAWGNFAGRKAPGALVGGPSGPRLLAQFAVIGAKKPRA
ncbi:DUF6053 domain-containing protein [Lysobacter enzymogenes]|uniref:DUF6053 domain-containing protein n=1 Tax=Lysobacter enzymogenes TaxID=69 RepID=UPI003CCDC247